MNIGTEKAITIKLDTIDALIVRRELLALVNNNVTQLKDSINYPYLARIWREL